MNAKFITRKQLSERWAIPIATLTKWDERGKNPITVYKIGVGRNSGIRYSLAEIEAYESHGAIKQSAV